MREIYGERDGQRGFPGTYMWLVEEVGEVSRSYLKARDNLEEEMADVLAWLLSLANLADIDLGSAFREKYSDACPRCGRKPCACE